MISVARIRELLGPDVEGKSDVEVEAIRQALYDRGEQIVSAFELRQVSRFVGTSAGVTERQARQTKGPAPARRAFSSTPRL